MLKTSEATAKHDAANNISRGLFSRSSTATQGQALNPMPATTPLSLAANQPSAAMSAAAQPKAESGTGNRLLVGPDVKLKGAEILDCDTLVVEGWSKRPWIAILSASPSRARSAAR